MVFWIKNAVFLIILLVLAYFLVANEDVLFSETVEVSSDATDQNATPKAKPKATKKTSNSAAEGLSRFYANLHGSDDDGPRIRNNIVYLPEPKGDLVEILEARRLTTRPLLRNWRGTVDNRPFRKGQTLHQKLVEYAEQDGLDVIWWLDRDFLVKDPFRINKDIVHTAYWVGKAIGGHFQDGLSSYFCYKQRTLVLIEKELSYLDEECLLLPLKSRQR
ncbi:TcpQ domain-containing protein [Colwellia sp. 1_MG-2023]|uniref:TcpQ domain-containing protein n=1 Tax=Colwellia sp. 1_MG-2023 TaxID=3062649 RepID=UPI0026E17CA3|nr:TcpQ domain-containing protein [Colwellia sp. 1_MG-2023]MDO6445560.1 TcpQ domain-containing protein [Colwellia sp. 1_MG-2023]